MAADGSGMVDTVPPLDVPLEELLVVYKDEAPQRIQVLKVLGRGAFATVFQAKFEGQIVALKVLTPRNGRQPPPQIEKMFIQECAALKLVNHSNVLKCFGLCELGVEMGLGNKYDTYGMLLEFCEGGTLRDILARQVMEERDQYTVYEALVWLQQVASALRHFHESSRPIIHRDIKLENILLQRVPGPKGSIRLVAKLADLGLGVRISHDRSVLVRRRTNLRPDGIPVNEVPPTPFMAVGHSLGERLASLARRRSLRNYLAGRMSIGRASKAGHGKGAAAIIAAADAAVAGAPAGSSRTSSRRGSANGGHPGSVGGAVAGGGDALILEQINLHFSNQVEPSTPPSGPQAKDLLGSGAAASTPCSTAAGATVATPVSTGAAADCALLASTSTNAFPEIVAVELPSASAASPVPGAAGFSEIVSASQAASERVREREREHDHELLAAVALSAPVQGVGVGSMQTSTSLPRTEPAPATPSIQERSLSAEDAAVHASVATPSASAAAGAAKPAATTQQQQQTAALQAAVTMPRGSMLMHRTALFTMPEEAELAMSPSAVTEETRGSQGQSQSAAGDSACGTQHQRQQHQLIADGQDGGAGTAGPATTLPPAASGAVSSVTRGSRGPSVSGPSLGAGSQKAPSFSARSSLMRSMFGGLTSGFLSKSSTLSRGRESAADSANNSMVPSQYAPPPDPLATIPSANASRDDAHNHHHLPHQHHPPQAHEHQPGAIHEAAAAAALAHEPGAAHQPTHAPASTSAASSPPHGPPPVGSATSSNRTSRNSRGSGATGASGNTNTTSSGDAGSAAAALVTPLPSSAAAAAAAAAAGAAAAAAGHGPGPSPLGPSAGARQLAPASSMATTVTAAPSSRYQGTVVSSVNRSDTDTTRATATTLPSNQQSLQSSGSMAARTASTLVRPALRQLTQSDSIGRAMRRVESLLRTMNKSVLPKFGRQSSFQWVFGLTGQAGSCMYMAPEVHRKLPYNEKADVFSFGVMMYEMMARVVLLVHYIGTREGAAVGIHDAIDYANMVARGFRPPYDPLIPETAWLLINRCWDEDPVSRPDMGEVVQELENLVHEWSWQQSKSVRAAAREVARVSGTGAGHSNRTSGGGSGGRDQEAEEGGDCCCVIS